MTVVVVVQARLASHRLPGKVLLDLLGAPVLERMLERVQAARTPFETVVATSHDPSCDAIAEWCRRTATRCFRGHPTDLLDRHLGAANAFDADVVVKIPSDCPLIDPRIIDKVLGEFLSRRGSIDFASNLHPPSYPDGNDVEVMTRDALETAAREAREPWEREHTTPFIWDRPARFRVHRVRWERGLDLSRTHRFTLDYLEDLQLIRAVYAALWKPGVEPFCLDDILAFLEAHPEVHRLNARWWGTCWQQHHVQEFRNRAALGFSPGMTMGDD